MNDFAALSRMIENLIRFGNPPPSIFWGRVDQFLAELVRRYETL